MKSFIIACIAAIAIAIVGVFVLDSYQQPVDEAFSSPSSVRLGA